MVPRGSSISIRGQAARDLATKGYQGLSGKSVLDEAE